MEPKKGRKPIQLDAVEFQNVLAELEKNHSFPNRTELWKAVEATEWAKTRVPRPLTAQVAMVKAEELKLIVTTAKGKRGRSKGEAPKTGVRKKKVFSLPMLEAGIPVEERQNLKKTLEKAASGSLKARVKLMCLDCTNWQKLEVSSCTVRTCPMWDVRPYKKVLTTNPPEGNTEG